MSGLKSLFRDTKKTFLSSFEGGKLFTSSHSFAFAGEKGSGCQPGDSLGRFRAGPSLTKLKLSPRTMHSASISAGQHVRPHDVSIYVPRLRIPLAMGHRLVAARGTVR
eukprot:353915-Chlamydomonas_euryale.AAC.4